MKIFIGADHNGYEFKSELVQSLKQAGHEVYDEGDLNIDPNDDYPQFASKVVIELLAANDPQARGILLCGSGQGMCIAANRYKGIRAALCWNDNEARAARNDDDANILCIATRYMSFDESLSAMTIFLNTAFAGASRFTRRIQELDLLG